MDGTPPMKMEQIECPETSADEIQTPENHPQRKNTTKEIMISPREKHIVLRHLRMVVRPIMLHYDSHSAPTVIISDV